MSNVKEKRKKAHTLNHGIENAKLCCINHIRLSGICLKYLYLNHLETGNITCLETKIARNL